MARLMLTRATALLTLAAAASLLPGCTKDQDLYPSLSIRDQERVTGVFDPVEAEPYVPPKPNPETLGKLGKLRADAEAAHTRFLAVAERTRGPAAAGRGAAVGSEAWAQAQVALGDLAAAHSEVMVPLAELDILYVETATEAGDITEIEEARSAVEALVTAEDRLTDSF